MNPDLFMRVVLEALDEITGDNIASIAHAILTGSATDEQLAAFTKLAHNGMDGYDGCMIDVVMELVEVDVPHAVINHIIRTYVRLADKREQEAVYAAEERDKEAYKRMSGAPGYGA